MLMRAPGTAPAKAPCPRHACDVRSERPWTAETQRPGMDRAWNTLAEAPWPRHACTCSRSGPSCTAPLPRAAPRRSAAAAAANSALLTPTLTPSHCKRSIRYISKALCVCVHLSRYLCMPLAGGALPHRRRGRSKSGAAHAHARRPCTASVHESVPIRCTSVMPAVHGFCHSMPVAAAKSAARAPLRTQCHCMPKPSLLAFAHQTFSIADAPCAGYAAPSPAVKSLQSSPPWPLLWVTGRPDVHGHASHAPDVMCPWVPTSHAVACPLRYLCCGW